MANEFKRKKIKTRRAQWRAMFRKIMDEYQDVKYSHTSNSCEKFYRVLGQSAHGGGNPSGVTPSVCDFVCDVEMAALIALDLYERVFFKHTYVETQSPDSVKIAFGDLSKTDLNYFEMGIQEKLGKEFKRRGIYPLGRYFHATR